MMVTVRKGWSERVTISWRWILVTTLMAGVLGFVMTVPSESTANAVTTSIPHKLLATLGGPGATKANYFGSSVAVSGKTAIVGARATNGEAGAAYIYVKGASGWPTTPTTTLSDPGAISSDLFGSSVAVSGNIAVVGAIGTNTEAGAAYIYVKGASGWPTTPTTTLSDPGARDGDQFGWSVAVSGATVVVSASALYTSADVGAAYMYVEGASDWPPTPTVTLSDPTATAGDEFGSSVAVSGATAVVSAYGTNAKEGAAYIYVKGDSGWPTAPTTSLSDPAATGYDLFGNSVAISGVAVVVGAYGTNAEEGAAYIYVKGASGWPTTPTTTLSDPTTTDYDGFGWSVAVPGNLAVVGAEGTHTYTGAAYVYSKRPSGWTTTPTVTLPDPRATTYDTFGDSVALAQKTALISAPGNTEASLSSSDAYIYKV